ncbi:FAD-dependent monooxygenase [Metarhizium robertsii ARSEF 23]|uniref:FAD-dependent monooxygenase n=1 Tax=Metarhizium robertsii (strain ARSEF 23 / ATCC MYA-3075) TaxID=655844 RepID=E9F4M3_METRA|nr:FAD-dependent monooxygenase [Metarhizium robertsii ARSEF 23]EFY97205.1 FAD-dependent monooxygenase [Metarhizium robertsii ARSEF 23]
MAHEHYEIAIIGGGIAGLTLALLCERLGFSYILFEKRDSLEGDNGAGISLQANALRILDQLGVAEKVDAEAGTLAETYRYDEDGNQIMRNSALGTSKKRVGYGFTIMERAAFRRILWESITRRECIMAPCLVTSVEENEDEVIVRTARGSYRADLVVGADGVNSTLRRLVDASKPMAEYEQTNKESICQLKTDMSSPFTCTYGMSSATPGILPGDHFGTHRPNGGVLAFAGKGGTIFWFLFENQAANTQLPPRYSASDADKACQLLADIRVMPEATFGDVDKNAIFKFKIPLQEGVAPIWHTHRSVLVGDAACKISPASGMGACQAIEMCAVLMNELVRARRGALSRREGRISRQLMRSALEKYHEIRRPFAVSMMAKAHLITQICLCTPGMPTAFGEQIRQLSEESFFSLAVENWKDSPTVEDLELTPRARLCSEAIAKEMTQAVRERTKTQTK